MTKLFILIILLFGSIGFLVLGDLTITFMSIVVGVIMYPMIKRRLEENPNVPQTLFEEI